MKKLGFLNLRRLIPKISRAGIESQYASLPALVSVHIPKTAGTSFGNMIERAVRGRILFSYDNERLDPMLGKFMARSTLTEGERAEVAQYCIDNKVRCLHGHFPISRYHGILENARYITFLRHPIERIVSEYYFQMSNDTIAHSSEGLRARDGSYAMADYLRAMAAKNYYDVYGVGKYFDQFDFIGLVEYFPESIDVLARTYPPLGKVKMQHRNQGKIKNNKRAALSSDLHQELEELASEDFRIYAEAKKRLQHELATLA